MSQQVLEMEPAGNFHGYEHLPIHALFQSCLVRSYSMKIVSNNIAQQNGLQHEMLQPKRCMKATSLFFHTSHVGWAVDGFWNRSSDWPGLRKIDFPSLSAAAKLLVDFGADVNEMTDGQTLLMKAGCRYVQIMCRHLTCMDSSMSWDAMFKWWRWSCIGTTQAARTCESDQVKLLLELKADPTLKDRRFFFPPRYWKIQNILITKVDSLILGLHPFGL